MANFPKYVLKRSSNYQFVWVLYAVNREVILNSSETYVSKQGALNGIASSKRNVADNNFLRKTATNGQPYFLQIAGNGEPLGRSEMYNSVQSRDNGIEAVKRDAPIAEIEDLT
jgi:uncharacterized protein YegP (UPF0339 family)